MRGETYQNYCLISVQHGEIFTLFYLFIFEEWVLALGE